MKRFKKLAALGVIGLGLLAGAWPAHAQQSVGGSGLGISPTVSEFTIKPGAADVITITLKNITSGSLTARSAVYDFISDNATGTPRLVTNPNKRLPTSIKPFVVGLEDVSLAKGEQKKISVGLQAPSKINPGIYYGVVLYKAIPVGSTAPKEGEVSLSASVGTIVLITVPGNLKQQLQLAAVHIYDGKHEGSFFFKKPTAAGVELKNLGNDLVKPFGTVTVERLFGKQVYSYQLNNIDPRSNILPASSRIFRNPLKNINTPGRYTVVANVTYGNASDILVMKKSFWYIPLWLSIILLALILLLLAAVYRAYHRYRRGIRPHRSRK